ncbi:DNA repair protein RadC [Lactobacillus sp. ESL0791]|uniref:JAB domain-containing protein n=1 Tax=Lactobacillus sp. ESL0791 TaxID=2983234 RepID=UPI0023F77A15|nr:DNA repair protein RadC [Lactobacillus sp. ESL0791]MDF7638796.1 DNA repair protein RadC [Lactobacillus sp. ESL0791]
MKIEKTNHYLVNTDTEVLFNLFAELEDKGITDLQQLKDQIISQHIESFSDLLVYTSGPTCDIKIAVTIEEIMERLRSAESNRETILTSSHEVGTYLADKLAGHKQEEFWAIYIDNSNHIVAEKMLFRGTLDKTVVHPREIFRWAMIYGCAALFVVHNHPSGRLLPSQSDLKLTRQLDKAAELMQIRLLDHFIVGKEKYLSLKERELF